MDEAAAFSAMRSTIADGIFSRNSIAHSAHGNGSLSIKSIVRAVLSLWFAFYNFCRVHSSLRVTGIDAGPAPVYTTVLMPGLNDGLALLGGAILVFAATIPLLISEARARRELRERTRRKKVEKMAELLDSTPGA